MGSCLWTTFSPIKCSYSYFWPWLNKGRDESLKHYIVENWIKSGSLSWENKARFWWYENQKTCDQKNSSNSNYSEWLRRKRKIEEANSTYPADWHLICGQSTSLVRTNNWGTAQGFHRGKTSDNRILLGHSPGSKSQAGGNDSRQTLRNSSNSKSNSDFKVIDSTSNPGATMNWIIEVTNIYYPNSDADKRDDFRQLLSELIQFLLERGPLLLSSHHLITNFANFCVYSCCNNHSHSFTSSNISTLVQIKKREEL